MQVSGCADIEHSPKKLAVSMLNLREEADNVSTHPPLSACNALDSIKARFLQRWGLGLGLSHCPPISILSKTLYRSRASAKVISFQTAPLRDAKICKAHFRGDPSQSRASGIIMSSRDVPNHASTSCGRLKPRGKLTHEKLSGASGCPGP